MTEQNRERLQKALSRAGIASRRGGEELIQAGRVKVNGKIVTELGTKIDPTVDKVTVDDEPVAVKPGAAPQKIYIMLNKPAGYLSTVTDPQGRPTIMDLVDGERLGRLYPVGRLDADSEGLLILTNDGAFANALSHPRFGVEKEYEALVDGIIAMNDIERLRRGVPIRVEDNDTGEYVEHVTRPAKVDLIRHEGSNSLVRFILKEGKKRQIRLMADAVDHPVIELRRVRQGTVKLGSLTSGKYRNLTNQEVKQLEEASKPGATSAETSAPVANRGRSSAFEASGGRPTARPGGPTGGSRGRPAASGTASGRVEPFKTPGGGRGGPRRFGERRFEENSGERGDRRGPSPSRGPRTGPARFDRDTASTERPAAPFRRGPGRGGPGNASDFESSRERGGSNFDRPANPRRSPRPENDSEGARPFRSGPGRSNPGYRRDNESSPPAPRRGGPPPSRKSGQDSSGGGGQSFPARRGRPNPSGFVPASERPAPTPGRGRPPRTNPSAPSSPGRERGGPPRNRPGGGPRQSGPGRPGRNS